MYAISLLQAALKELQRLPAQLGERIEAAIDGLADNPRPRGSQKLKGTTNEYRTRVRVYRVIYEIDDKQQTVVVSYVRHCKDAYRQH